MTVTENTTAEQIEEYLQDVREDPSHRNYWSAYKKIQKLEVPDDVDERDRINITLLSSFTIDLLATYLDIDSRLIGLTPDVYVGPFNQYQQAILDDNSKLYRSDPDVVIFNIHLKSILPKDFMVNFPQLEEKTIKDQIDTTISTIEGLLSKLSEKTDAVILFSNFIVPTFSPFGIIDNKQPIGYKEFYRTINRKMVELYRENSQIYIFDLDNVASEFGKDRVTNNAMYYRGTILFSEEFLPVLSRAYGGYIKALKNMNRKAIILDLDNTLWGGIIGEDGIEGIKLNNNYPGKEFVEFQKLMLTYYNRGIILAVNSKNNYEDAIEAIEEHPYMVLNKEHFAAMRINWQDKVQNIIEIADELNIGIDSLVFVDDNPVERERVKQSLPQVLVVDMPEQPSEYVSTFEKLNDFNSLSLTKEDLKRGEMYVARRKREDLKENLQSMENFIETLEIKAHIKQADDFSLPRVTSLVNRTNQFNVMTRRYTENQIKEFHESDDWKIYTLQVTDKFGDEGIVGVAMIEDNRDYWRIDNFMMSCRVIGRKIETAFIHKIVNDAIEEDIDKITSEYIPTKKNNLVKELWHEHDFKKISEDEEGSSDWEFKISGKLDFPEFLEVIEDE